MIKKNPQLKLFVEELKAQNIEQDKETNIVLTFEGNSMNYAEKLIAHIFKGYEKSFNKTKELLDKIESYKLNDVKYIEEKNYKGCN